MKNYLKLMRVKHYIKNFLIFLPLIFNGNLFNKNMFFVTCLGFISFSFLASTIYIFNDLYDYENDKKHPLKKNRPIASGKVSKGEAKLLIVILLILAFSLIFGMNILNMIDKKAFLLSLMIMVLYFFINIMYSIKMKHLPIIDIILLALGFVLRVYFGGSICDIEISSWLNLTVLSFSLYLVIGKRKGELEKNKASRPVLKYYTVDFLDKFMYSFLTLTLVFYSLWCISTVNTGNCGIYSIFIIIFIVMKYSLNIENSQNEYLSDPVEVLFHDKILILAIILYFIYMGGILYGKYLGL